MIDGIRWHNTIKLASITKYQYNTCYMSCQNNITFENPYWFSKVLVLIGSYYKLN